ncbi:short-chain dehydrogenase/reductase family 16C member 6-like isoform X2 [Periplaneta americana]
MTAGRPPSRCLQALRLALTLLAAALHSALSVVKSTYRLLRPQPAKSLAGEVVLVTGAGRGIGRRVALEFWAQGCTVVCVDDDEASSRLTARHINERHRRRLAAAGCALAEGSGPAHAYSCDVRDRDQVAQLARRVLGDLGRVDILVNNARVMPTLQAPPSEVVDDVNLHLLSHFWTLLAFLPGMVQRRHGHVVAISCVAGLRGLADKGPHSASKHAVTGLLDAVAEELQLDPQHVKLTCAHPYLLHPEQLDLRIPQLSARHAARQIVDAVRHDLETVTVPRNLHFWLNVFRTLPQDARDVWRDVFQARGVSPQGVSSPAAYSIVHPSGGVKT